MKQQNPQRTPLGFQTLKERLQSSLNINRVLLILAVLLYVFSTDIANYNTTVNEAWTLWKNILHFDFILVIFALRKEVAKLITKAGFKIILYILINYFIDEFLNNQSWSWNDFLTIFCIIAELIYSKYEKR